MSIICFTSFKKHLIPTSKAHFAEQSRYEDTYKSVVKQGNYGEQILKNIMSVLEEK